MINKSEQFGRQEKAVLRHSVNTDIKLLSDAEQARQEVEDIHIQRPYVLRELKDFTQRSLP